VEEDLAKQSSGWILTEHSAMALQKTAELTAQKTIELLAVDRAQWSEAQRADTGKLQLLEKVVAQVSSVAAQVMYDMCSSLHPVSDCTTMSEGGGVATKDAGGGRTCSDGHRRAGARASLDGLGRAPTGSRADWQRAKGYH
jgi:hypothetical protein